MMFHLGCANKLGNCPKVALKRFRFTCLYCRWRRREYEHFVDPPYWINYTLKSTYTVKLVDFLIFGGVKYVSSEGKKLEHTSWHTVHIDPRGHFTSLRSAVIIVLDAIMAITGIRKPLLELCEFMSCYPTF